MPRFLPINAISNSSSEVVLSPILTYRDEYIRWGVKSRGLLTLQEKANLARIRDNQRRSRARRKEYLQELEARLRSCELLGIEASSEIQVAARRVADENRKLRALLSQNGIGDGEVEAYLQNSGSDGGSTPMGTGGGALTKNLETLLSTKKTCCPPGTMASAVGNVARAGGSCSRGNSVGSTSTVQSSTWEPIQMQTRRTSEVISQRPHGTQFLTPSSDASRASSVSYDRPIQLQMTPVPTLGTHTMPNILPRSHTQMHFDFGDEVNFTTPDFHPQTHSTDIPQHAMQPQNPYIPVTNDLMNSCSFATDMITTMVGGNPEDVRADLGCAPGTECQVDNQLLFNVMDRYSGHDVGF
jgi:hypothetical protein